MPIIILHLCFYKSCPDTDTHQCDSCDRWFCVEHGQKGGDHQIQDVGPVAYPALCAKCKGVR